MTCKKYAVESRCSHKKGGILTNTGGTSGQSLSLILDGEAYAREWAHMHTIWEESGYKTSCIKLTFRGMNLGSKPLKYNFIHNEFQVNAYCSFERVVSDLSKVLDRYKIEFLHGYPSGIYEFIKNISEDYPDVLKKLKKNLKSVFLGSEFPAPIYRNYIEGILDIPTLSWYGHTEMAVLAYEKNSSFVYYPLHSYGFTEAVEIDGSVHLIGTTIHNSISPLIRYDTGDVIEPLSFKGVVLESFQITEGRLGEFIIDNNGRRISLTALIFGRHHALFGRAEFIQVKQVKPGYLTIYVTTKNQEIDCSKLFDATDVHMEISFKIINSPFKTSAGKVPLLITDRIQP